MSDVFITYAREDYKRAKALAFLLEKEGWSVWWDRRIPPGRSFDKVIEDALDSARCVVVLWSRTSVESDWVRSEAAEGKARNVLVPILLEDVRIPLEFRRIQTAQLLNWTGTVPGPDFDRFRSSLAQILGEPSPSPHESALHPYSILPGQARSRRFSIRMISVRNKRRLLLGGAACLTVISLILIGFYIFKDNHIVPPKKEGSIALAIDTGQSNGDKLQTKHIGLSELVKYKIDVYFDKENEIDRIAAARVKDLLARKAPGTAVILAPRPLDFVTPLVPPASYEVRYDPPLERDPAMVLTELLNRYDSNWKFSTIPSWSKTRGVLSLFLFSRAHSDNSVGKQ